MSYYKKSFDELVEELRTRDFELARVKMQLEEANYIISLHKDSCFADIYLKKWNINTKQAIYKFDKGISEKRS